ncbi:MAG TPA: hypothetical protein DCG57_00455, partial [Candidatus Riflebacteria bacterium]|nr:hypothetical protein [Candidatus Riflebacteria bacterium]
MKRLRSVRLCILVALAVFFSSMVTATGSFVATSEGIRYIVRDESGNITQTITPEFDARSGKYYVKGNQNRIIS